MLPYNYEPSTIVIYGIQVKDTKEIVYIGKSNDLKERIRAHLRDARGKSTLPVHNWMRKHDMTSWEFIILDETTKENWQNDERAWIAYYRSINQAKLNLDDGGAGRSPYIMSDATKQKLSQINMGKQSPQRGAKLPNERKAKVSQSLKELWQDPDYRRRMSEAHKGKSSGAKGRAVSQEVKDKISQGVKNFYLDDNNRESASIAHRGHKPSLETRNKRSVTMKAIWAERKKEK